MGVRLSGKKIEVETEERFCDFCNKVISYDDGLDYSISMHFAFGFYSKRDGENWDWDSCHLCAEKIIQQLEALRKEPASDEFHGAD